MIFTKVIAPRLLRLVHYQHPILRKAMEPIHFPLSKKDKQWIQDMKYSIQTEQLKKRQAPYDSAAGMAANQWGINKRIFLFCPEDDNQIEVVINPDYKPLIKAGEHAPAEVRDWEGCFSIPLTIGHVNRYLHIQAIYQNIEGEMQSRELNGWIARIWQHETDHLNGILFDDPKQAKCNDIKQFFSKQEYNDWKPQESTNLLK